MRAKINLLVVWAFLIALTPLHAEESVSWEQCVSEAVKAHPDLYSALAVLQQAEADKSITKGALLPQLSFGVNSSESGSIGKGAGSSSALSYSLSAQQLLYDGQKTSSQIASNAEAIKAAQYNVNAVSANLRFTLRSAFTQLLKAQDLVGLTVEIADRRQNNVRLISLRYQGGREHIGSLRQAEADLAQAQFEVSQAKRGLILAQTNLASALGRDTHQPLKVQGTFNVSDFSTSKPDLALLVKDHPLFQQLDTRSKAARFDLDASRSAFSPQLYLNSSVGRGAFDRLPTDAVDWSAGVTISVPIYEGGSGRARVAKARAFLSQQNAQEKSGFLLLFNALEQSWKSFQDARQLVVVQKKQLEAANERSKISNAQYSNGLVTFDDWVIIENNLVNAKKDLLNAEADMLLAEAQWIQSKGGTLEGQQE
ncbi:MAG: TolC family protein [Chlorobiaceae bacterium]|nr:TolC family protein [Chlorobiaceae bacterium]